MNFQEIWEKIIAYFNESGWRLVIFMAVLVAGVLIVRALCGVLRRIFARGKTERTLAGFIVAIVRFALYIVLIFVLAGVMGVDMTPLATAISAALVAVGLALQSSLSNLANGLILVSTKPFKEGDYVDINGTGGTVKNIGLFVTELITPDNKKIIMTNSAVLTGTIINFSERPTRRVDLTFSADYGSDVERVKKSVRAVVNKHPLIIKDPEPNVRLHEIKESRLSFIVRVWVNNADYWAVYWDLNEQIFARFKKDGIIIPHNKLDVRLITHKEGE